MSNDPLSVAATELAPGERLIWADRPDPSRRTGRRWLVPLFGLVFTGFAAFWTVQAMAADRRLALVGLLFVAVGILVTTLRFWRRQHRQIVYAIADRRLVIIRDGRSRRVRSFQPADLETLERRERPDGSGDVIFGRETVVRDGLRRPRDRPRVRRRELGFFEVADARRVEAAIRALREGRDPAIA